MNLKQLLFLSVLCTFIACESENEFVQDDRQLSNGLSFDSNNPAGGFENNGGGEPTFNEIVENPFIKVEDEAISTFSIDADGASYSNVRRHINSGLKPHPDGIRTEELVNYFNYDYPEANSNMPISLSGEVSSCPWKGNHLLMRVGIKGRTIKPQEYPASNLVFLIDVSGSMNPDNRLPLLQEGFKRFVDQLRDEDRVALVTYSGNAGLVLNSTSGSEKDKIKEAIDDLKSGGSTNGEGGIKLAYEIAEANFVEGANNRIIVASDGNFNVGIINQEELVNLIEEKRESGIFLTILGVGENYNDATLEQIANNGNGSFEYLDNEAQLDKVFIDEYNKFFTVAKDVKVQIEFNKQMVKEYRLIGYENRLLSTEEFLDDEKDAGEIGAGQSITALYEIIPTDRQDKNIPTFSIDFRYKQPDADNSQGLTLDVYNENADFSNASANHRFAASVASYSLLLRDSEYKGNTSFDKIYDWANGSKDAFDPFGYKSDFLDLVKDAEEIYR